MDAPRTTRRAAAEWAAAAGILVGLLVLVSGVLRDVKVVSPIMPLSAREAPAPAPTAAVPGRAVSVPLLILPGGVEIRVGDGDRDTVSRLADAVEVGPLAIEHGLNGDRQTRMLEYRNVRFALVVEPFERDIEPRISAIYLK